jgi:5-methylcytosine-specific restriction endonuclease McrA
MPVLRLCSRHRTLSPGRCPECVSDRHERRRVHVSAAGKKFRAAILKRDDYVCHHCGGEAESVDYLQALVDGGEPFDEANAVASCLRCNFRRSAEITNRGGVFAAGGSRDPSL